MGFENFEGTEQIKDFNKEAREQIVEAYLEFQSFYNEILERSTRNPGLSIEPHNAWQIIDRLASELWQVQRTLDTYPEEIPNQEVQNLLAVTQRVMNKAQGFYHGEYNLLDKNGNWLENLEHLKK